jgi:hypothetical protein
VQLRGCSMRRVFRGRVRHISPNFPASVYMRSRVSTRPPPHGLSPLHCMRRLPVLAGQFRWVPLVSLWTHRTCRVCEFRVHSMRTQYIQTIENSKKFNIYQHVYTLSSRHGWPCGVASMSRMRIHGHEGNSPTMELVCVQLQVEYNMLLAK